MCVKSDQIIYNNLIPYFIAKKGITKTINQIYIVQGDKNKELPESILQNIQFLKDNNPQWKYKLYNNVDVENYILDNYGQKVFDYYQRINPEYGAARADFFRYLLIYKEGGIYLDLKSRFEKPLNKVLLPEDEYILSHWDNEQGELHEGWGHFKDIKHIKRGEYVMGFIIASPGHPFLRAVILEVMKRIDNYNPFKVGVGLIGVLRTTGPIVYSTVIDKKIRSKSAAFRLVKFKQDLALNINIFESQGMYFHKKMLNSNFNVLISPVIITDLKFTKPVRLYFKAQQIINEYLRKFKNVIGEIELLLK